jgi:hypothetical protein
VLNLGDREHHLHGVADGERILLSTFLDRDGESVVGALRLRPHEGVVVGPI